MTEATHPVTTITGHDYSLPAVHQNGVLPAHHNHLASTQDIAQEDDGQISCICGYLDDDGWTVQCDRCKRWQHQVCYYPAYEDRSLPDDLQHYCLECAPRDFDHEGARVRQSLKRDDTVSEVNGVKRPAAKSHKKKIKEPPAYTNGWPLDKTRHDRNSASPRDQPPPAKRPKTSHRPSDSVATNASTKGHSRKRNMSNVNHRRSLSHSPDTPIELYSEQFMRCYQDDDWAPSQSNLHTSTDVRNALSHWLAASEDEFRDMHGCEKREVMFRWDGELDAIPNKAQLEPREEHDDRIKDDAGRHPSWKWLTVREPIAEGAFIGELKGSVGFKDDYIQEPANRWSYLRHPEPFTFFHPRLPIYIDARNEGTELRYVRRSCAPNARLSVLVTEATDYHFCFMATQQIDPGMEIAIAWDTGECVPAQQMRQSPSEVAELDLEHLGSWVSKVLSNCGPCACHGAGNGCPLSRFDRRLGGDKNDVDQQSGKGYKSKKKKTAHHISPLDTNLHSRSGSEARPSSHDDERSDSRSPSASAGRDSGSRDITPNTHYSHTAAMSSIPEMSERERKKLAKEEEMFKKQEEERTGKQGKKKRSSGGSTLSTPNASSSKQLGFPGTSSRYADGGNTKQSGLPSAKPGRRPKGSAQRSPVAHGSRVAKRPKVDYVDSEVQCNLEQETEIAEHVPLPLPLRPLMSSTNRLLQRCALNNARRRGPAALVEAEKTIHPSHQMDLDDPSTLTPVEKAESPTPDSARLEPRKKHGAGSDTEMIDASPDDGVVGPNHVEDDVQLEQHLPSPLPPDQAGEQSPNPPAAPPWPPGEALPSDQGPISPHTAGHPHKPTDMHLQMPPPPSNPFSMNTTSVLSTGTSLTITQSPISLVTSNSLPLFSPSVNAAVAPSPAKKKLSLSDYTRRNKTKEPRDGSGNSKGERESSPASVTSTGPPVGLPALQNSLSDGARSAGESAVEDDEGGGDVKMEDAEVEAASAA